MHVAIEQVAARKRYTCVKQRVWFGCIAGPANRVAWCGRLANFGSRQPIRDRAAQCVIRRVILIFSESSPDPPDSFVTRHAQRGNEGMNEELAPNHHSNNDDRPGRRNQPGALGSVHPLESAVDPV